MPVICRLTDRGNPDDIRSDMSANEIYGSPVISTDPFELARQLAGSVRLGSQAGGGSNASGAGAGAGAGIGHSNAVMV